MSAPPGFYGGSGTTADPYYGYYGPNPNGGSPFAGALLDLDRADAIKYMSGEIDERPIVFDDYLDTGVDPNDPGGTPPPAGGGGGPAPPNPNAVDAEFEVPIADVWSWEYPQSTIFEFFKNRGGMGTDNPYHRVISSTSDGLDTLWSLMDPTWAADKTDTAGFRNFVDDLFGAGGNVSWNLGTFRQVLQNMLTGNIPEAMLEVIQVMDSPSEAMSFFNDLYRVFGPLMGERRQRMFGTLLSNIWQDMSNAYSSGESVQQAFTDALTRVAGVFGLGS